MSETAAADDAPDESRGDVFARADAVIAAARQAARGEALVKVARDIARMRRDPGLESDDTNLAAFEERLKEAEANLDADGKADALPNVDTATLDRFMGWFDGDSARALDFPAPPVVSTPQEPVEAQKKGKSPEREASSKPENRKPEQLVAERDPPADPVVKKESEATGWWPTIRKAMLYLLVFLVVYTGANALRGDRAPVLGGMLESERLAAVRSFGDAADWTFERPALGYLVQTGKWVLTDLGRGVGWIAGLFSGDEPDKADVALAKVQAVERAAIVSARIAEENRREALLAERERELEERMIEIAAQEAALATREAAGEADSTEFSRLEQHAEALGRSLNTALAHSAALERRLAEALTELERSNVLNAELSVQVRQAEEALLRLRTSGVQQGLQASHVVSALGANVRRGPSTATERLGTLEQGAPLRFTGQQVSGWREYEMEIEGQTVTGWIADSLTEAAR